MNDDTIERIGRELVEAIEAALAADARVQACVERARAAGLGFRVALNHKGAQAGTLEAAASQLSAAPGKARGPVIHAISESDRRFLRSLRIAADER
ncbi:MAG TPA: hypothetical protein VK911_17355 [Vicinamibacterales bacterium]|nr:hypothetical protein [Vicinamibacterales bacterium]